MRMFLGLMYSVPKDKTKIQDMTSSKILWLNGPWRTIIFYLFLEERAFGNSNQYFGIMGVI
jgi:hypothetical protein